MTEQIEVRIPKTEFHQLPNVIDRLGLHPTAIHLFRVYVRVGNVKMSTARLEVEANMSAGSIVKWKKELVRLKLIKVIENRHHETKYRLTDHVVVYADKVWALNDSYKVARETAREIQSLDPLYVWYDKNWMGKPEQLEKAKSVQNIPVVKNELDVHYLQLDTPNNESKKNNYKEKQESSLPEDKNTDSPHPDSATIDDMWNGNRFNGTAKERSKYNFGVPEPMTEDGNRMKMILQTAGWRNVEKDSQRERIESLGEFYKTVNPRQLVKYFTDIREHWCKTNPARPTPNQYDIALEKTGVLELKANGRKKAKSVYTKG